jgi:UDP-N-acetylmuramate--alanine ligase
MTETNLSIHFIGCGGIGMCGLALLSLQAGYKISGSDIKKSENTELLQAKGASINTAHSAKNLSALQKSKTSIVVYSSAIQNENPELREAQRLGIKCYKRGEYLALMATQYKRVVSIAGSHGKTTVTAMIVHILKQCNMSNIGYLIGGWPVGAKTLGEIGKRDIFIIEADESDLSLSLISSHIGVVLNLDDDHSWNVGGKEKLKKGFSRFAEQSDLLLYACDKSLCNIFKNIPTPKKSIEFKYEKLSQKGWEQTNNLWGEYQKKNAAMAVAVAIELGISQAKAIKAINTFSGVERRMQKTFSNNSITIFEDYAHHPAEVKAAIATVREAYPNTILTVIFQPHRYARLKYYFNEFACELKKADRIFIVPVFSAWSSVNEKSSKDLAKNIGKKAIALDDSWENIAKKVTTKTTAESKAYHSILNQKTLCIQDKHTCKKSILLILGAGDVNNVVSKIIKNLNLPT